MPVRIDVRPEEANYLIWKYLLEHGMHHTAFALAHECDVSRSQFMEPPSHTGSNALLRILTRGCQHITEHLNDMDSETHTYGLFESAKLMQSGLDGIRDGEKVFDSQGDNKSGDNDPETLARQDLEGSEDSSVEDEFIEDADDLDHLGGVDVARRPSPMVETTIPYTQEHEFRTSAIFSTEVLHETGCSIEWHPTDSAFLSVSFDKENPIRVWELDIKSDDFENDGCVVTSTVPLPQTIPNDDSEITAEAKWCTKKRNRIVTITEKGSVKLFDRSGRLLSSVDMRGRLRGLKMSHLTGKGAGKFACITGETRILVWRADNRNIETPIAIIKARNGFVTTIEFVPTDDRLILAAIDDTVFIYDITTECAIKSYSGHNRTIVALGTCPKSTFFITGSDDCTMKVWTPTIATHVKSFATESVCLSAVWNSRGKYVACQWSDEIIRIYDLVKNKCVKQYPNMLSESMLFSPDGKYLTIATVDGNLWLFEAEEFELVRILPKEDDTNKCVSLSWAPDSTKLVGLWKDGDVVVFNLVEIQFD